MAGESLADRARRDEAERGIGENGYRLQLEPGEMFEGRWRGEALDTGGEYGDQTLYLLWDSSGSSCYVRGYASLRRKVERHTPQVGDRVGLYRGDDYASAGGTGYSFGLSREPCDEPLPEAPEVGDADEDDDW